MMAILYAATSLPQSLDLDLKQSGARGATNVLTDLSAVDVTLIEDEDLAILLCVGPQARYQRRIHRWRRSEHTKIKKRMGAGIL